MTIQNAISRESIRVWILSQIGDRTPNPHSLVRSRRAVRVILIDLGLCRTLCKLDVELRSVDADHKLVSQLVVLTVVCLNNPLCAEEVSKGVFVLLAFIMEFASDLIREYVERDQIFISAI